MSWPCSRSRSGWPAARCSSSPATVSCRPSARSASIRASSAARRSSSRRACLGPDERVVGQVGQHVATPQRQRLPQHLSCFGVPARVQRGPPGREPVLEPRRVQLLTVHRQQVTVASGDQDTAAGTPRPVRFQRPAQVKHVGLHGGRPPRGRVPAPDVLGQPVHRYDLVRLEKQQREHGPLPRAAQRHHTPGPGDLQAPEDAERPRVRSRQLIASAHPPTRPVPSGREGQRFQTIPPPAR